MDWPVNRMDGVRVSAGFTLLELSIVLLVVGLLLGGVLKGQQVVEGAKIKRMAMEAVLMGDAVRTYRRLYHAWPGDDPRAVQRWPAAGVGNGDGVVSGGGWSDGGESGLFWSHLRYAQLIVGEGGALGGPRHLLGGRMGVEEGALGLSGLALCLEEVPSRFVVGLELQFDDGIWERGRIRTPSPPDGEGDAAVLVCMQL